MQVDLLCAYLEIVALRLGRRLRWHVDVPAPLRELTVPPMLLQPIVENAVKHGIEPSLAGGEIAIAASRAGSTLLLTVADTGRGFRERAAAGATGIGLANLRARLAGLFGDDGSLMIEDMSPQGARVTLRLPIAYTPRTWSGDAPMRATPVASP